MKSYFDNNKKFSETFIEIQFIEML